MTLIKAWKKNKSSLNDEIWLYFEIDEILYSRLHIAMWYDMIWYHMIWHDVVRYNTMSYSVMWYDMIWYDIIWYDIIWYDVIWHDVMWCGMSWYDVLQNIMIHYETVYHVTARKTKCLYNIIKYNVTGQIHKTRKTKETKSRR